MQNIHAGLIRKIITIIISSAINLDTSNRHIWHSECLAQFDRHVILRTTVELYKN